MKWLKREYLAPHLRLMVQPWLFREIVERTDLHGLTTHPLSCATLHLKGQWATSESVHLLALASACHRVCIRFISCWSDKIWPKEGFVDSQFQATQPMMVEKSQRHKLEAAGYLMSPLRREKRVFECSSLASSLSSQTLPRKWSSVVNVINGVSHRHSQRSISQPGLHQHQLTLALFLVTIRTARCLSKSREGLCLLPWVGNLFYF